jgi:hypothetical protein
MGSGLRGMSQRLDTRARPARGMERSNRLRGKSKNRSAPGVVAPYKNKVERGAQSRSQEIT